MAAARRGRNTILKALNDIDRRSLLAASMCTCDTAQQPRSQVTRSSQSRCGSAATLKLGLRHFRRSGGCGVVGRGKLVGGCDEGDWQFHAGSTALVVGSLRLAAGLLDRGMVRAGASFQETMPSRLSFSIALSVMPVRQPPAGSQRPVNDARAKPRFAIGTARRDRAGNPRSVGNVAPTTSSCSSSSPTPSIASARRSRKSIDFVAERMRSTTSRAEECVTTGRRRLQLRVPRAAA